MFKSRDHESIFMTIDMPLYQEQCSTAADLLESVPEVIGVTHDYYGSFIFTLEEDTEQTEELYDRINEALEEMIIDFFDLDEGLHYHFTNDAENPTIEEIHRAYAVVTERLGYAFNIEDIKYTVIETHGEEEYENYIVEQKLIAA